MKKYRHYIILGVFVGLIVLAMAVWTKTEKSSFAKIEPASGVVSGVPAIGGDFTLVDHNRKTVTQDDYKESYKLIFFGFTHCPEICPTGLQKMAGVLETLGSTSDSIQALFVTVDPARDTPDVMKEYVAMFSPRIIGLTGTEDQIKHMEDQYKVYAAKVDGVDAENYTMNHSAYIFFMSPDGTLLSLFSSDDGAQEMINEMNKSLAPLE